MTTEESDSDDSLHEIIALSLITAAVNYNLEYNPSIAMALYKTQQEFRQRRFQKKNASKQKQSENHTQSVDPNLQIVQDTTMVVKEDSKPKSKPHHKHDLLKIDHQKYTKPPSTSTTQQDESSKEGNNPETNSIEGVAEALISLDSNYNPSYTTIGEEKNPARKRTNPPCS